MPKIVATLHQRANNSSFICAPVPQWSLKLNLRKLLINKTTGATQRPSFTSPSKSGSHTSPSTQNKENNTTCEYVRPPLPMKREALYDDVFQYRWVTTSLSSSTVLHGIFLFL